MHDCMDKKGLLPNYKVNILNLYYVTVVKLWTQLHKYSLIGKILHLGIDGLVQDCSNSIANALELLQSCIKPSVYG